MQSLLLEKGSSYATVQLDQGKVNAINTDMVRELGEVFQALEADKSVKGILLTGRPHCFSAGLDVVHLTQGGPMHTAQFWRYYLGALQTMVRFSKPLVCAITGYAPAGATILTLAADYRVMGRGAKHTIGMHEFRMSLLIPELLSDVFAYVLGEPKAWEAVQQARLYQSDEAKAIGLVHESVEVEEVLPVAEKHLKKLLQVHLPVFQKSKAYFRKGLLKLVDREIEPMVQQILKDLEDPYVQQMIQLFVGSLKN